MGILFQEKNVLSHNEAPDRVIDRGVFVITLVDRELQQMLGERSHRRVVHWDSVFSFHGCASKGRQKSGSPNEGPRLPIL
jgi:hypothetical protein